MIIRKKTKIYESILIKKIFIYSISRSATWIQPATTAAEAEAASTVGNGPHQGIVMLTEEELQVAGTTQGEPGEEEQAGESYLIRRYFFPLSSSATKMRIN